MAQHVTIHLEEAPILTRALYRATNTKPHKCFYCGKPAHYLQIAVKDEKHLLIRKICHGCETKRRQKLWTKKKQT